MVIRSREFIIARGKSSVAIWVPIKAVNYPSLTSAALIGHWQYRPSSLA
jgi:hypothetical protein